ncbi:MAG: hypothetical protein C4542_09040 [Dehalococcoidia bacterium]|nr:MAG: hypothetical protein C4542_09040 [Dehalococcoidia bacterium]
MTKPKVKCPICDVRPINGNGNYCKVCFEKIQSDRSKAKTEPSKFLTYKGFVVGLVKSPFDSRLHPIQLKRDPTKLPKAKTINLDTYCDGFSRDQIKEFKKCVLRTVGA